jgi:hypothetical protein
MSLKGALISLRVLASHATQKRTQNIRIMSNIQRVLFAYKPKEPTILIQLHILASHGTQKRTKK